MDRIIDLSGCLNFRDLGGYPTADGRALRWRQVFRSDALHHLTRQDVVRLRDDLAIGDVIDLRSSAELHSEGRGALAVEAIRFHHHPLYDGESVRGAPAADMLLAALMTCAISVCGFLCGSVIGCLGCWAKLSRSYALRWLADVYTTVLRGVPDLLVIYLFYFGSSMVLTQLAQSLGLKGFLGLPGFFVGVVAISVISGAYQLEVFRGAVNSVAIGSIEAGRSIGLGKFQLFSLIIAPQALRLALPGLGNVWLLVLKDSALISVVGLVELMRQSQIGAGATHQPFLFYCTAMIISIAIIIIANNNFIVYLIK